MKAKTNRRFSARAFSQQLEQRMLLSTSVAVVPTALPSGVQPPAQVTQPDALAAAVNAALASAPAGDPIYMKYGSIGGDVTDPGFQGDIQLNSFQWGVGRGISSPNGATGREASAPSISEIVVGKNFDSSTIPLIQEAFGGTPSTVEIDFANTSSTGTPNIYLKFDLFNTLVSGYSVSSGGDRPSESLSLNFTKISVFSTSAQGQPQAFSYDLATQGGTIQPAALFAPSAPSATGSDPIYMKYDGIQGDVTAPGAQGEIQLDSFQFGVNRTITGTSSANRESSTPSVSEITVGKNFDSATVPLVKQAFVGNPANVEIDFVNGTNAAIPYLKIKLSETLISGYSVSSGGDRPSESISLNFTKISLTAPVTNGPQQNFTYDLKAQKATIHSGRFSLQKTILSPFCKPSSCKRAATPPTARPTWSYV